MSKRSVATVVVNIAIFLVLVEAVSLAIYYAQTGDFFYVNRKTYETIPETQAERLTPNALHPYFGPTHRPGHPFSMPAALETDSTRRAVTNNFGFFSPHDYPYQRHRPGEFIVGIFGGSVGAWFCQLGADRMAAALKQQPALRGRDVTTLCFSHEGYKQPQQALLLAYFLSAGQEFDLVLNIDGFNEVTLGSLNDRQGLDFSMPSAMHMDPLINLIDQSTLTPEKLESLARISRYRRQLDTVAGRINGSRLASVHVALAQYYGMVSNRRVAEMYAYARLPSNASKTSIVYVTPKLKARSENELFEDIARAWVNASAMMNDLLAARSVPYIHVLQPNQYHTQRRFGPEEARLALNEGSPFREGVRKGYPVLIRMSDNDSWRRRGVRFLDATRVFDREPAAVYMDDCCHYTRRGNELLAEAIAKQVAMPTPPAAP